MNDISPLIQSFWTKSGCQVEQRQEIGGGRGVFAQKEYKAGDVIAAEEPLFDSLRATEVSVRCAQCYRTASEAGRQKLLVCAGCKFARYCCQEHQRLHWPKHKALCHGIKRAGKIPASNMALVLQALNVVFLQGDTSSDIVEALDTLCTNEGSWGESDKETFIHVAMACRNFFTEEMRDKFVFSKILQLFYRFGSNAFTIADEEVRPIGSGVYLCSSMLNHSCCPNAVQTFEGKTLVLRAMENIENGEQLTIAYGELAETTMDRRQKLKDDYYFLCQCQRCIRPEAALGYEGLAREGEKSLEVFRESLPDCIAKKARAEGLREDARGLAAQGQRMIAYKKLRECCDIYDEICGPLNLRRAHCHDQAAHLCIDLEDFQGAAYHTKQALPSLEIAYSRHSPMIGLQWAQMAKLHWYLENTIEALNYMRRAVGVFRITRSPSSKLRTDCETLLQEMERAAEGMR